MWQRGAHGLSSYCRQGLSHSARALGLAPCVFTCGGSKSGISPPCRPPGAVFASPATMFCVGRHWPAPP